MSARPATGGESLLDSTRAQLDSLDIRAGRPLLAVDADDVLVHFVDHLTRWLPSQGVEMRLTRYELEGSMFETGRDDPLPFRACIDLINRFFETETTAQQAIDGAAAALGRLSAHAQIVVLTNVPRHARAARIDNLRGLGIDYPLIENGGGKGPALGWMAERAGAPVALIDDSPRQIASAARAVPQAALVHFRGTATTQRVMDPAPEATGHAADWTEAEALLLRALAG